MEAHYYEMGTALEKEITLQEKAGFFWMHGLVQLLDTYAQNRSGYQNLAAFMPVVTKYFLKVADEMKNGKFAFPEN